MNQIVLKSSLALLLILSIFACKQEPISQEIQWTHHFENQEWDPFTNIEFDTTFKDTETAYGLVLEITLSSEYNQDVFSFGTTQSTDAGESIFIPSRTPVKNPKGAFIAKPNSEGLYVYQNTINPSVYFSKDQTYTFSLQNLSNKYDNFGVVKMKFAIRKN